MSTTKNPQSEIPQIKTSVQKKKTHFKRNVAAIAISAVMLAAGGIAIFNCTLASKFDKAIEHAARTISKDQLKLTYTPDNRNWHIFTRDGYFTLEGKNQDGSKYSYEFPVHAVVMPSDIYAELTIPENQHPALKALRDFGVEKVYICGDWKRAELTFKSTLAKPYHLDATTFGGVATVDSLMGTMEIPYDQPVWEKLPLTIGASNITYQPTFLPGLNIQFEQVAYTAPVSAFLETDKFTTPDFSIMQIAKIKADMGREHYELNTIELNRSLQQQKTVEHNDFSMFIGADQSKGKVSLTGNNNLPKQGATSESFVGNYTLTLSGDFFERNQDRNLASLVNRGYLYKDGEDLVSQIEVKNGQAKFNGHELNLGNVFNGLSGKPQNTRPAPQIQIPVEEE